MTNLNMTIISSGWRLCLEYPSSCLFVCLYVFLSVCPRLFSDTVKPTVTTSHIVVTYVPGQKPIEF